MTESGGWLRLKVFEVRTEQVLNVTVALRPGAGPMPITVIGRLHVGAAAIGAETTGITLTTGDGRTYDLDFGAARPPGGWTAGSRRSPESSGSAPAPSGGAVGSSR